MSLNVESISQGEGSTRKIVFLYHQLRACVSQYSYVVDTKLFEHQADLFVYLLSESNSDTWPELTFDDGHMSDYEFAMPILQARGLPARFFITAGWTGTKLGYMGWSELQAMHRAGFLIGSHGWTHKLLTHCNADELKMELGKSRLILEDRLGTNITTLSLPGGRYNRGVLAACAEAGYTRIYTSEPKVETMPLGATVGRLNVLGSMQMEWIAQLFEPNRCLMSSLRRKYRMKEAAKMLLGDRLYKGLWAHINRQEIGTEDNEESAT